MTDRRIHQVAIAGMTCEERAWHVIDAIWSDGRDIEGATRRAELTDGQRAVYSITWVEHEVRNGGFDQCFANPAGGLAPEAIVGGRLLSLDPYADLITRAAELALGTAAGVPRAERQRRVDALSGPDVDALDGYADEFYDLLETHPLDEAICEFIEREPSQFFLPGDVTSGEVAQALLGLARRLVAQRPPRDLVRIEALLREAGDKAEEASAEALIAQIRSLASQLPDLRGG